MSDRELKNNIIQVLKKSDKPLTFDEIANQIKLNKDFWRITAILNQLKQFGIVEVISEPFKPDRYKPA